MENINDFFFEEEEMQTGERGKICFACLAVKDMKGFEVQGLFGNFAYRV